MQTITITTRPEAEPITLADAKTHLRIDHDTEDALINLWIKAAREYVEIHTGRQLAAQTATVKLDGWPAYSSFGPDHIVPDRGFFDFVNRAPIRLEGFKGGTITSVVSFTYLDRAGATQTLSPTDYQTDFDNDPPIITPAPFAIWPLVQLEKLKPITIVLQVGANPPDVPAVVKAAMFLILSYWDENRGGEPMETPMQRGMPAGALRLLNSAWTGTYK